VPLPPAAQELSNHSQRRCGLEVPTVKSKTERTLTSRDNPPLSHHIPVTQIPTHQRQRHFRHSIGREGHFPESAKLLRWWRAGVLLGNPTYSCGIRAPVTEPVLVIEKVALNTVSHSAGLPPGAVSCSAGVAAIVVLPIFDTENLKSEIVV
jgi:hypothetical protein